LGQCEQKWTREEGGGKFWLIVCECPFWMTPKCE